MKTSKPYWIRTYSTSSNPLHRQDLRPLESILRPEEIRQMKKKKKKKLYFATEPHPSINADLSVLL